MAALAVLPEARSEALEGQLAASADPSEVAWAGLEVLEPRLAALDHREVRRVE